MFVSNHQSTIDIPVLFLCAMNGCRASVNACGAITSNFTDPVPAYNDSGVLLATAGVFVVAETETGDPPAITIRVKRRTKI